MKFINNTEEKILVKVSDTEQRWVKPNETIEIENLKTLPQLDLVSSAAKAGLSGYTEPVPEKPKYELEEEIPVEEPKPKRRGRKR